MTSKLFYSMNIIGITCIYNAHQQRKNHAAKWRGKACIYVISIQYFICRSIRYTLKSQREKINISSCLPAILFF